MDTAPWRPSRRTALGLTAGGLIGAVADACAGTGAEAAPVTSADDAAVRLVDDGATVTISNALISVIINKSTGRTTSIRLIGSSDGNSEINLVGGRNGGGYSTFNYSLGRTAYGRDLAGGSFRLVSRTSDRVEIAVTVDDPTVLPFGAELHAAVERDSPGIHYWMVFRYPERMPDGVVIAQLRYAVAAGDPSFRYFVVDDARGVQQRPPTGQVWTTLQDTTYALPDGSIYSKYQNISDLEGDSDAFLISNGRVGLAVVQASKEFFAGGPTKQELTCHDYHDGEILLWHPFTSHYGSPALAPPKGWAKLYGPFFLHVTEAVGATDPIAATARMWQQVGEQARREKARWPYAWLTDPLYAPATRSTVSGRLTLPGGRSTAGAWVLLSAPGPDWQYENLDHVYSVRADAGGGFRLPAVRPGRYTLTAFVDGVLGEFRLPDVQVPVAGRVLLGDLAWREDSRGRTLWQIGTPDRSTRGFHVFGGPQGFRRHLTWLEYPYEFPDGVDFTIGRDDPATDWNFFQPMYRTPGTPAQLSRRGTTVDRSLTTWRIRFDSSGYQQGTATLDIALAASVFGTLRVALNGAPLATFDPLPGPPGDNASYRLAARGMYRRLPAIVFAADLIVAGENVVTLSPARPPKAPPTAAGAIDDWMEPMAAIMYDVIRLQVDERRRRPPG